MLAADSKEYDNWSRCEKLELHTEKAASTVQSALGKVLAKK